MEEQLFPELFDRSDRAWFAPESGWCFFQTDEEMVLANPAELCSYRFWEPIRSEIRSTLEYGQVGDRLRALGSFDIPHWDSIRDSLHGNVVASDELFQGLALSDPTQLWIEVQGSCNEECIHCYAESAPADLPSLSWETVDLLLDDACRWGFSLVQFTGGDPLLWNPLPRAVHEARDRGLEPEIYTNGLLLDETLYEELLPAEPRFAFSFYSHDPEVHDSITQREGSWQRTLNAIKRAQQGPTPVRIGAVIVGPNRGHEEAIESLLNGHGVPSDSIRFSYLQTVGRGETMGNSGSEASDATLNGSPSESSSSPNGSHLSTGSGGFNPGKICVSYEGDVLPCIFQREVRLGSVHERSLGAILRDPNLKATSTPIESTDPWKDMGKDRLSCSECRFHSVMLHYGLHNETDTLIPESSPR